jgi:hypothetical protein
VKYNLVVVDPSIDLQQWAHNDWENFFNGRAAFTFYYQSSFYLSFAYNHWLIVALPDYSP